jgi:hypothetical protein
MGQKPVFMGSGSGAIAPSRNDAFCYIESETLPNNGVFAISCVYIGGIEHLARRDDFMTKFVDAMWTTDDIQIEMEDELTDGNVVTARITTPAGALLVMAEVESGGRELLLYGLHMHGETIRPNELGPHRLRQLSHVLMELVDLDALVIQGATRTSGAHRGHLPRPLRFTRKLYPASGTDLR